MFLLAHISDVHLAPLPSPALGDLMSKRGLGYLNWLRKRRAIHRPEVLAAIVTDLNAQQPDHVAVTGDLVNLSLSNEFGPARAWLDAFGSPHETTFVPGNHDAYVRAAAGRAAQDWGDYMRGDAGETSGNFNDDSTTGFFSDICYRLVKQISSKHKAEPPMPTLNVL